VGDKGKLTREKSNFRNHDENYQKMEKEEIIIEEKKRIIIILSFFF